MAQTVKRLSAMQETQVQSLGWEDPLEKEMAAHSSILSWKIPWTPEPGRLLSMGSQRVGHDYTFFFFKLYNIVLVLPNIEMNSPQVYRVPHPEPSSLLPPLPSLWVVPVLSIAFL